MKHPGRYIYIKNLLLRSRIEILCFLSLRQAEALLMIGDWIWLHLDNQDGQSAQDSSQTHDSPLVSLERHGTAGGENRWESGGGG